MHNNYSDAYLTRLVRRLMKERLALPEKKIGGVQIKHQFHRAGERVPIVNFREALFAGRKPAFTILANDLLVHQLVSKQHGVWMTDNPSELLQTWRELATHAAGNVLIGGLGLGVLPRMIVDKRNVKDITVVETNANVVRLISPYCNYPMVTIHLDDIHKFAQRVQPGEFSVALLDTWQGTGEWVWQTQVVPLRRALQPKVRRIYCWAEETMVGQIAQMLYRACEMDAEHFRGRTRCHYYAFRRAVVQEGLRSYYHPLCPAGDLSKLAEVVAAEERNRKDPELRDLMHKFLWTVGTPGWEKTFGKFWDEAWSA